MSTDVIEGFWALGLTEGGPGEILLRRLRLAPLAERARRAAMVLAGVTWIPLLVLSAIEHVALGSVRIPFLYGHRCPRAVSRRGAGPRARRGPDRHPGPAGHRSLRRSRVDPEGRAAAVRRDHPSNARLARFTGRGAARAGGRVRCHLRRAGDGPADRQHVAHPQTGREHERRRPLVW